MFCSLRIIIHSLAVTGSRCGVGGLARWATTTVAGKRGTSQVGHGWDICFCGGFILKGELWWNKVRISSCYVDFLVVSAKRVKLYILYYILYGNYISYFHIYVLLDVWLNRAGGVLPVYFLLPMIRQLYLLWQTCFLRQLLHNSVLACLGVAENSSVCQCLLCDRNCRNQPKAIYTDVFGVKDSELAARQVWILLKRSDCWLVTVWPQSHHKLPGSCSLQSSSWLQLQYFTIYVYIYIYIIKSRLLVGGMEYWYPHTVSEESLWVQRWNHILELTDYSKVIKISDIRHDQMTRILPYNITLQEMRHLEHLLFFFAIYMGLFFLTESDGVLRVGQHGTPHQRPTEA